MEPTDVRNREKATDAIIAPASDVHAAVEGRIARVNVEGRPMISDERLV
ncbi:hypothetical protein AB1286_09695 [Trinickia sp. NRRL B-1857]